MRKISKNNKILLVIVSALAVFLVFFFITQGSNLQILNPKGTIAQQQKDLLVFAAALSSVVVIPVFIMTGFIAYKYRESNTKAKYSPDWESSKILETIWWGVPIILITILSVVTYKTSHSLDPFNPIVGAENKTKTIQVVALQYKWLFIYPEENIATVNHFYIPEDTPIKFEITSDAPMNSFWIPQLGGQIYAMSGMTTELNLMAEVPGTFEGSSANISGAGFADMKFQAIATNAADYDAWVNQTRSNNTYLDNYAYKDLATPGASGRQAFSSVEDDLYDNVVMKYMSPDTSGGHMGHEGVY